MVNQINGVFKCLNQGLLPYYIGSMHLMSQFKMVGITHISRYFNQEADEIAQRASGFKRIKRKKMDQEALRKFLPFFEERGLMVEVNEIQVEGEDWKHPLIEYLSGNCHAPDF